MNTIKELREQQARLATEARDRMNEIKKDTTEERAAEIEREFDAMMAEYDKIGERRERLERIEAAEARLRDADPRRPRGEDREDRGEESDEVSYRQAFLTMLRAGGDTSDLSREQRAALRAGAAGFERRAQTAGTAAAGGYTVPTELAGFIDKAMAAWGPMYSGDLCTTIVTSGGNSITIPTVDDTASRAGAHTEGSALTDDGGKDVVFGQATLGAYAFDTEFVRFSLELAQDSAFNIEAVLADLLGGRLGQIANEKLTTGSGSSDVKGVVTASSLGKTAASATAIAADEIIDLLHSVDPAYRASPRARFMMSDSTLAAIRKLKDGQGNYLWQMGDVTAGQPGTLLGYRFEVNQAMDSLAASKKVLLFGDFGKFYVRKVGAPVIGVLRERFWPDLGIAGLIRFDGEIGQAGAIKHLITAAS